MDKTNKSNKYIDAYVWVSHGNNVSAHHNYYKFETKFKYLTFYSTPFQTIDTNTLQYLDSCKIITGTCPMIPITNTETGKKYVYLPPLVFTSVIGDYPSIVELTGLYYLKIQKIDMNKCNTLEKVKIMDHSQMIDDYGSGENITYSDIFKCVTDDCKKRGLNPEKIVLGIFSCQVGVEKYEAEYTQTSISDLIPKIVEEPSEANIYDNGKHHYPSNSFASPTLILFNELQEWAPLAGITHQGCGLNVLSYYNIIETRKAREQTVCLSIKGTSIFKIVDYLNRYIRNQGISYSGFMVVRYSLLAGLDIILKFLRLYSPRTNQGYSIITKLYRNQYQPGTQKFSQIGHTVSFARKDQEVYYIDPQSSIIYPIYSNAPVENIVTSIKSLYRVDNMPDFEFIDIIYTIDTTKKSYNEVTAKTNKIRPETYYEGVFSSSSNSSPKTVIMDISPKKTSSSESDTMDVSMKGGNPFPSDRPSIDTKTLEEYIQTIGAHILTRTDDITYGGGKRKKIKTAKKILNKSKRNKKIKNRKTRRIRKKQHTLDPYEELVIKLDKKNGVPSALQIE